MDNVYMNISYWSVKGGINNLQIVQVFNGQGRVIKTFTSLKMLALARAKRFIKQCNKPIAY